MLVFGSFFFLNVRMATKVSDRRVSAPKMDGHFATVLLVHAVQTEAVVD